MGGHPVVERGKKASDLTSDKKYKQDWEDQKAILYFPYTMTPEYETKANVHRMDATYKKDHEETKSKNYFDVSSTPVYEHQKAHGQATADVSLQLICNNTNHTTVKFFSDF